MATTEKYITTKEYLNVASTAASYDATNSNKVTATNCYVSYTEYQQKNKPVTIETVLTGC